jgi:hypothetical protein
MPFFPKTLKKKLFEKIHCPSRLFKVKILPLKIIKITPLSWSGGLMFKGKYKLRHVMIA